MDFKAKLGPLPVWAWGLIVGGFVVVWMWVSQRNSVSDVEVTGDTVDADYGGTLTDGSYGTDFSTVTVVPPGQTETTTAGDTNADWLRRAVASVVDSGVSTLSAQTALQKYLSGQTLSSGESSIVNAALGKVGLPPEGVDTPDIEAPVTPTTPAAPAAVSYATRTVVTAPANMKYGTSYPVKIVSSWVQPSGKSGKPKGNMVLEIDGVKVGSSYGYNGEAVVTIRPTKSQSYAKDGVLNLRGRIVPNTQTQKTQASVSNPVVVRVK